MPAFTERALIAKGKSTIETDVEMETKFRGWLGPRLCKQFDSPQSDVDQLRYRFDTFIIFIAGRKGTEVLESAAIRQRVNEWHYSPDAIFHDAKSVNKPETGLSLLSRFCAELMR